MSEIPTKTVPIDSLTPHPENYNQHPESQIAELAESDQSFGQYRNVVVWSPDSEIDLGNGQKLYPDVSYILAGNGYWLGRRRAGRDTIEVKDYTGIPYEDALMLMQVDNAAPLGAQPDPDRLKVLLEKTRGRAIDRPKIGAMLARLKDEVHLLSGESENGGPPSLDDLENEFGDPDPRDFWPVIHVQVSPETHELFLSFMNQIPGEDEAAKVGQILGAVDAALLGSL